jgi:hypothetical protein
VTGRLVTTGATRIAVALAVSLTVAACSNWQPKPLSYWLEDDRTLGIFVGTGVNRECALRTTEETAESVRVFVECEDPIPLGPEVGALQIHLFEVKLQAPLGQRQVVDGTGNPATRCTLPRCEGR